MISLQHQINVTEEKNVHNIEKEKTYTISYIYSIPTFPSENKMKITSIHIHWIWPRQKDQLYMPEIGMATSRSYHMPEPEELRDDSSEAMYYLHPIKPNCKHN